MQFFPAILTGNPDTAQEQLALAASLPQCDIAHIDLIDGFFADNLTITPADLVDCQFGPLQLDFHLMAVDPEDVVNEIIEFHSMLPVRAVIAQVEKMSSEQSFVTTVRRQGWQAGLSLDIGTDLSSIDDDIWPELQIVQIMGVHAGEQGQAFIPSALKLAQQVDALRRFRHASFQLTIDGGVRPELTASLAQVHADGCTIGSYLWRSSEPADRWAEFMV